MTATVVWDKRLRYCGDLKRKFATVTGATTGAGGNAINVAPDIRTVISVTVTLVSSNTVSDAPAIAISGSQITVYTPTTAFNMIVEGTS